VDRGGLWELITVAIVARHATQHAPAYEMILQRGIDDRRPVTSEEVVDHGTTRYTLRRRVLSRKELLAMPIPIEWLK